MRQDLVEGRLVDEKAVFAQDPAHLRAMLLAHGLPGKREPLEVRAPEERGVAEHLDRVRGRGRNLHSDAGEGTHECPDGVALQGARDLLLCQ
jgi:hypothetical protein